MTDIEKLGSFYLGKVVDPATEKVKNDLFLYESKNLTTHAVCVGMTGSGKTGLGFAILEEAALDKIPAIIIDPKGDLTNLLLTFPNLAPEDFIPWVDPVEAEKKGIDLESYSKVIAEEWEKGLTDSGQGKDRIQKLRDTVDMTIYTPASTSGVPISILNSFELPPFEVMSDTVALRDRVLSLASSLLGLVGVETDPMKSREHIMVSKIIDRAWHSGKKLDIESLIQNIQKPPFNKIGALDVETFFPQKERLALSIKLNSLLAAPGFQAWMEGDPLDIQAMLYNKEGKPKLSIFSIAHLNDNERMFFVTLLLNEFLLWMRRQSGTSNLRAILYMDEIFGYFPPTAMPPSKLPMMTLLKQARAFGVGIVLSTQNPVDLDYKGLANCGTWFIGKLQTERDKARVLEGLRAASNGDLNTEVLDKLIGSIQKRMFIMRSVNEAKPILFQTRWIMSYLRGPLTLPQIEKLTIKTVLTAPEAIQTKENSTSENSLKPILPPNISEYFFRDDENLQKVRYQPRAIGFAKLHFVDSKAGIDCWKDVGVIGSLTEGDDDISWDEGVIIPDLKNKIQKEATGESSFEPVSPVLMSDKNYSKFEKSLAASLYRNQELTLFRFNELKITSEEGESEENFRKRIVRLMIENRDKTVQKIKDGYADKIAQVSDKLKRAEDKASEKKQLSFLRILEMIISFLTTLIGAFFGKKLTKGTITRTGTTMRQAGRVAKESQDASRLEESADTLRDKLDDLKLQQENEIRAATNCSPENIDLEKVIIRPKKSDISVDKVGLVWYGKG